MIKVCNYISAFVISLAFLSCNDEINLPKTLLIQSQADLDLYCEQLLETTNYNGSIVIRDETENLDLSCFKNIRSVSSSLILEGTNAAKALRHIESAGREGLALGGTIEETIVFDKLFSTNSINIFSNSTIEGLHFPSVEILDKFSMGSFVKINALTGLNKVISMTVVNMPNAGNQIGEIDVFEKLRTTKFLNMTLPSETKISSSSFDGLLGVFIEANFSKKELHTSFQELFPKLKTCERFKITSEDVELKDLCYLKSSLESNDIKIILKSSFQSSTVEVYNNLDILNACQ